MKKFKVLFAVLAVLAMATTAFASAGDLSELATASTLTTTEQNNGAIAPVTGGASDYDTTVFYFSGSAVPAEFKLGMNATLETPSATATNKLAVLKNSGTVYTDKIEMSKPTQVGSAAAVTDVQFLYTGFTAETDTPLKVGTFVGDPTNNWEGTTKTLAIKGQAVTFTASESTVNLELTDTSKSVTIAGAAGDGNTVDFEIDAAAVDGSNEAKIKAVVDGTNKKQINITPDTAFVAGKSSTITVKLKKATVTEGSLAGIAVAGIDSSAGTEVVTITVKVLPAATASADIAGAASKTIVSSDVTEDIVISTDIKQDTDAAKAILKSDDVKVYVDGTTAMTVSYDVVTRGDTDKFYNAIIKADYLNTLDPGSHTVFVGNLGKAEVVRTDNVTIIVEKPLPPVEPVAPTTAAQKAAIEALVVGSADLGLATVASHDAVSTAVTVRIPSELSNDVRAYRSIDQTVATSGDYVMIDGSQITVAPKSGESVTFFKNFGTITDADRVSLREAMSGDKLEAAILIVDNELPSDVKGAWKSAKDSKKGLVIRKVNGTNVVVIYDGNKNGRVVDPIEAHVNRGSSSSSCDMGFGLAAVAGLAALALRKRSK